MNRLASVILIVIVGAVALFGCAKKGPAEMKEQSPDALALMVESTDSASGVTTYVNQRGSQLTGAYFYPYIERVGDVPHLRIKFRYYDKGAWLNVSRYIIEVDGVSYPVTFDADTDRADYEQIDGGTADIMDILADEDEIAMLEAIDAAPDATIAAFGMEQQKERAVSADEVLIIAEVLSAYKQMTTKHNAK